MSAERVGRKMLKCSVVSSMGEDVYLGRPPRIAEQDIEMPRNDDKVTPKTIEQMMKHSIPDEANLNEMKADGYTIGTYARQGRAMGTAAHSLVKLNDPHAIVTKPGHIQPMRYLFSNGYKVYYLFNKREGRPTGQMVVIKPRG